MLILVLIRNNSLFLKIIFQNEFTGHSFWGIDSEIVFRFLEKCLWLNGQRNFLKIAIKLLIAI